MSTKFAMARLFSRRCDDCPKRKTEREFRRRCGDLHDRHSADPPQAENRPGYDLIDQLLLASSTARVSRITVTLI
jgi:hypothetical protein